MIEAADYTIARSSVCMIGEVIQPLAAKNQAVYSLKHIFPETAAPEKTWISVDLGYPGHDHHGEML